MERRWRAILLALALGLAGQGVQASWMGIDSGAFACRCPAIVSGEIVKIDEAAARAVEPRRIVRAIGLLALPRLSKSADVAASST